MSCVELKRVLDPETLHNNCFSASSSATENGKRFGFDNRTNAKICKGKIDGCFITDNAVRKCDFFFEVRTEVNNYFLVELKGVDLISAVKQIESTYDFLKKKLNIPVQYYTGIIVASAVPGAANQSFRALQDKLCRSKGLRLERRSGQHIVRV